MSNQIRLYGKNRKKFPLETYTGQTLTSGRIRSEGRPEKIRSTSTSRPGPKKPGPVI